MEERSMATTPPRPSESILAAGLLIEGKIEGRGDVRVVGRFKGTVNVEGELTVEAGASVQGEVAADTVLVEGEIKGQVTAKRQVQLRESGAVLGDVKAETLTVAAGSKMRGNVEFGWKADEMSAAIPLPRSVPSPPKPAA
jgi:cytoskeletal protein CcmA (bactofilin family)